MIHYIGSTSIRHQPINKLICAYQNNLDWILLLSTSSYYLACFERITIIMVELHFVNYNASVIVHQISSDLWKNVITLITIYYFSEEKYNLKKSKFMEKRIKYFDEFWKKCTTSTYYVISPRNVFEILSPKLKLGMQSCSTSK